MAACWTCAFGAVPDDDQDDTAAIQQALDQHPNGNRIIYLPSGKWIVRDILKWPAGARGGLEQKRTILQGGGQSLTVLHLPDATPGFTDAAQPKAMIWTGNRPAQRFRNAVRDRLRGERGRRARGTLRVNEARLLPWDSPDLS